MDQHYLTTLTRSLTRLPSRREVLHALAGAGLGISTVGEQETTGAKKKRKRKRKTQRRTHATPPPGPVTMADATCRPATSISLKGFRRYAQTFVAQRSGQLTSASFRLTYNQKRVAFYLEIWAVDMVGVPSTVLAGTAITNVPTTDVNGPPRIVTGAFPAPPVVVAGQAYALAVTGVSTMNFEIQGSENDPCPDGLLFLDPEAEGLFLPQAAYDLSFTTFVTA